MLEKPIETPPVTIDYQKDQIPAYVRELIETHLAIEREEAQQAGALGFMARAMTIATLPHRDPKTDVFQRKNGNFVLRMLAGAPQGLPYGTKPRLLLSWVATEAVRTKSRHLHLGDTLADFLRNLDLSRSGGRRGDITAVRDQMARTFGTTISCSDTSEGKFEIKNIQLVEQGTILWDPQDPNNAGKWQTELILTEKFFKEICEAPVPVDLRVFKALKSSSMALDIYSWLTYRVSYLRRKAVIPWAALQGQFGSGYAADDRGLRDFRRAFLRELQKVMLLYPQVKVDHNHEALILHPSPTHISRIKPITIQHNLEF